MISRRKLTILALVVGMAGALLATAGIASGEGPFYADRGVLLLDTSGNGYRVDWYEYASPGTLKSTATASQAISIDSKCNVSLGGPNLISITPTGSTFGTTGIGAVSHGLGVKTKNNCSTEQGQIAVGQKLKLSLGSFFDDTFGIESAEVDVEGKRNAKLGVTYFYSDATTAADDKTLGLTSDNGPDSGTGDNNIVILGSASLPFRAVEFRPISTGTNSPAVSIEGGGDGSLTGGVLRTGLGTNYSVFELVQKFDGQLICGDVTFTVGGVATMEGTFKRLDNLTNPDSCTAKPYNLNVSPGGAGSTVLFNPVGSGQLAAYSGNVFAPVKQGANPTGSTLQYDAAGGFNFVPMKWCKSATFSGGYVGSAELPAGETWCIAAENTVAVGSGNARTTWTVYGEGDPRMSGA